MAKSKISIIAIKKILEQHSWNWFEITCGSSGVTEIRLTYMRDGFYTELNIKNCNYTADNKQQLWSQVHNRLPYLIKMSCMGKT